jgi:hypothetical protein
MTPRKEGWNVVLAGFWNRSIFLPEWALPKFFPEHETPGREVQTEIALLQALPLIYRDRQVSMEISGARLAFAPQTLNDECLLRCEQMARDVLRLLPETPVHAVGINLSYREQLPPGHVLAMFNDGDEVELTQQGWVIGERKLIRKLTRGDDGLSLTLTLDGEAVFFDFNFHSDASGGIDAAKRAVEERRILRLRDSAVDLLRDTYHLELEDDDGGHGNPAEV